MARPLLAKTNAPSSALGSSIAIPVGITAFSPPLTVIGSSIQAERSMPALPGVALKGIFAFSRSFFILKVSIILQGPL